MADLLRRPVHNRSYTDVAKVLLVDNHLLVAEAIASVVAAQDGFEIVTSGSLDEALALVTERGSFDVVLLDFNMPGSDGFSALSKMIDANGGRVAVFSGMASRSAVERALALGAAGFIPKTLAISSFLNAIRFISAGEIYLPSEYMRGSPHQFDNADVLKAMELTVLMHLCEGLPNKDIAQITNLTEAAVKVYVKSICTKLGAKNRTQAVLAAIRLQLY